MMLICLVGLKTSPGCFSQGFEFQIPGFKKQFALLNSLRKELTWLLKIVCLKQ